MKQTAVSFNRKKMPISAIEGHAAGFDVLISISVLTQDWTALGLWAAEYEFSNAGKLLKAQRGNLE